MLVLALANTIYWNGVYDANLDHMVGVRIQAAHYLRESIPISETVAASDVGALRFEGQRTIIDLGGLIEPSAREWFRSGEIDTYLMQSGVRFVAFPGRIGSMEEGCLDIAEIMGLTSSRLIDLSFLRAYEIDYQRWKQGYLPTGNYQASVAIYEVLYKTSAGGLNERQIQGVENAKD